VKPIIIKPTEIGAIKINSNILEQLIGKDGIEKGEKRFDIKTFGPWQPLKSVTGLAVAKNKNQDGITTNEITIFGDRTLLRPESSGYNFYGKVSINGKKYRSFDSTQLFELEDGRLIDVAILYVCDYY